jgi:hypothetical protein
MWRLTYPQKSPERSSAVIVLQCSIRNAGVAAKSLISLERCFAPKAGKRSGYEAWQAFSVFFGRLPTKLSTGTVESLKTRFES